MSTVRPEDLLSYKCHADADIDSQTTENYWPSI